MELRVARTEELSVDLLKTLREMLVRAFGDLDDADWSHALGGVHLLLEDADVIVAHACVVSRSLETSGRLLRTGFVEAVATDPARQGSGHGSTVMRAVATHIEEAYDLGALSTGENEFYERLGWETWLGPTGVRTEHGVEPTPDEDGGVMVLRTPRSASIDLGAELTCEWRPGDVW